jgi:RNA polymerase sigma-54 factor
MLQQKLNQKMLQKLSPQQIQLMKLFQIPTALFEQRIKEELESNPALDEGSLTDQDDEVEAPEEKEEEDEIFDEPSLDNFIDEYIEDDPISYNEILRKGTEEEHQQTVVTVQRTFHDTLMAQFELLNLEDPHRVTLGEQIIGSIDDDGYLRRDIESIIDDLLFTQNIIANETEIEEILKLIQQFDPPGVGARTLQENLTLQLKRRLEETHQPSDDMLIAYKIIKDHFKYFSKKHYEKLIELLQIDEDALRDAMDIILQLNPKPSSGSSYANSDNNNHYVLPDFIVENKDGELSLTLNGRNAPDIYVNKKYTTILTNYRDRIRKRKPTSEEKDTINFIKQKIDTAKWFIDAVRQRQQTLYNTMYAILQLQRDYFLTGDALRLKPMILKDVSDLTNLDISTVSRVVNNKYVQTEFGTKRLKEFFSEALVMPDGTEISSLEVKNALLDIIDNEDKSNPYSDEQLKEMLELRGYTIARRTVTKYREHLHKSVARLRREL